MTDIFKECRERVSAESAARRYGLVFDRRGWAVCPFHQDKHPSMSFRAGRFRCWACNASGDSVDLAARLFGLEPLAAVERLNADFGLNLQIRRQPTPAEAQAARRRMEIAEAHKEFEEWRKAFISRLSRVYLLAHEALKTAAALDDLTSEQVLAVRRQSYVEYLIDILECGSIDQQMEIFRQRGRIVDLCERILKSTPEKSGAA